MLKLPESGYDPKTGKGNVIVTIIKLGEGLTMAEGKGAYALRPSIEMSGNHYIACANGLGSRCK